MHRAHPLVAVGRCILDGFRAVDRALVDGCGYGLDILTGDFEQTAGVEALFRVVRAAAAVEHDLAVLRLTQLAGIGGIGCKAECVIDGVRYGCTAGLRGSIMRAINRRAAQHNTERAGCRQKALCHSPRMARHRMQRFVRQLTRFTSCCQRARPSAPAEP